MSRKSLVTLIVLLVIGGAAFWIYRKTTAEDAPEYRFATVERGNLEAAVSATGSLSAVTSVQVGTQVSGQVAAIMADFNDQVKKGQVIARIDPTLQQQAVQDAEASLARSTAEYERSRLEFERNKSLFESKVLTEVEFNSARYSFQSASASIKSAQIALERARRNLQYTTIESPVDGIVVERSVDVGQTVTASMSTPQLFLIAKDLEQMQILASVSEGDIGRIEPGQAVRFTVQAYPDRRFEGTVAQKRLQSKTTENVVNYTVAVSVKNPDGKLLPGMTATLQFLTGTASDVLTVPNAALRFRPPEAVTTKIREQMMARMQERGGQGGGNAPGAGAPGAGGPGAGTGAPGGNGPGMGGGRGGMGGPGMGGGMGGGFGGGGGRGFGGASNFGRLWYLDANGELAMVMVRTGITDGTKTEVSGRDLKQDMQIVVGATQQEQATSANPFQQQNQRGGMGGGQRRGGGMF